MRISDWSSDVCSSDLGPYSAVLDVVKQYGEKLAGKVLVDITNPVAPDLTSFVTPGDSFGAPEIAKAAPANAVIVKAFNTLRSEEHTSELQSLMRLSYAVFCLKQKITHTLTSPYTHY